MSDPQAYFGQGIQLQVSDMAGSPMYTDVTGCRSFSGPGRTRDTEDVTAHSAPDGYRQYISTLRDGGEVTCDINWLPDDEGQQMLTDAFNTNDPVDFRMIFPTPLNDTYDFAGFVTDLTNSGPVDGALTKALTIKVTGPITESNDES